MDINKLRRFSPRINEIARKHGIIKIYVFGSIARGESSSHNDVDFLVDMQKGVSLSGAAGFGFEVEQLLGTKVDVIPIFSLTYIKDTSFVFNFQKEAVAL